jgi:hypothetical protein
MKFVWDTEFDTIATSEQTLSKPGVVSFQLPLENTHPITLEQNAANGCGGHIWPAGVALACYLLCLEREQQDLLRNKTLLELGHCHRTGSNDAPS